MRPPSFAQAAALYNASATACTPSVKRLLIFWPRYLRVRGPDARRAFTTRPARILQQAKQLGLEPSEKATLLKDVSGTAVEEDESPNTALQPQAGDGRYNDPHEYLDDYGDALPESTVCRWQAELRARPPSYAIDEYEAWLKLVKNTPPARLKFNDFSGEAAAEQTWRIGMKFETESVWKKALLRLSAQYVPTLDKDLRQPRYLGDPRAAEWSRPFLEADLDTQRSFWLNLEGRMATNIWGHVMLYTLHHHPDRALDMLTVSHFVTRQISAVELVFDYIAQYAVTLEGARRTRLFERLMHFLDHSFQPGHVTIPKTFGRAVTTIREELGSRCHPQLYQILRDKGFPLRGYTYLHFAQDLLKFGHTAQALDALRAAVDADAKDKRNLINSGPFRSVCCDILRRLGTQGAEGYQSSLQVSSWLFDIGVVMSTRLTSAIMLNALEADDKVTCLSIYRTIDANGWEKSSFTYEYAMRALGADQTPEQIQTVINGALAFQGPGQEFVRNGAIRCLGQFYTAQSPSTVFPRLLDIYRQYFDIKPLVKLGIVPAEESRGSTEGLDNGSNLPEPHYHTLHLMLHHYLANYHGEASGKWHLWQILRQLMREERLFAQLGKSPYIYATFIHALGQHASLLRCCELVLEDMLNRGTTGGLDERFNPGLDVLTPAAPNAVTMNAWLHSLLHHRQWAAADKVRKVMKERGISENAITYGSLINAYSKKQNVQRTAELLWQMEHSGFKADARTFTSLKWIHDHSALEKALERTYEDAVEGEASQSRSPASPVRNTAGSQSSMP